MKRGDDEFEHSLEMHLPMIKYVFSDNTGENGRAPPKIVPIIVGNLTKEKEAEFGALLAPYFARPDTLFLISSDFCHWGQDFGYQPYENFFGQFADEYTPVWEFIFALDMSGLELIENMDADAFHQYCEETENTICGRHPIGILLAILAQASSLGSTH